MAAVGAALVGMVVPSLAGTVAATVIGNLLASVALTALQRALTDQPENPQSGIQTRTATAGDSTPQTLIFGKYATAGNHVCPPMTAGTAGGAPNGFLTYVMDVSDAPVGGLAGLWINDEKVELSPPGSGSKGYLFPDHHVVTTGQYADHVWVKFFDGTQTSAYMGGLGPAGGGSAGRPWSADMIGRGIAYAVVRFRYNDEVFRSMPTVLYEVNGIGFYDPRKDSTVGGSGGHIWGNRATYEPSENPAVQVYNILRGIELPDGTRWGGEAAAEDLPLANWFAAMNECDLTVDGEPQYRASTEVRVGPEHFGGHEPAAVIEELLRTCSGQVSEYGGTWKMRAGPVGMPVAVLTDDDIIISEEQRFDPFPGLQETYNAVFAQYPEPEEKWVSKEAPPRLNPAWEAQDGNRRLPASLALGACPYPKQVQRVMRALAEDNRRHRRHAITIAPDYAALEPLDAVAWTSNRNGYGSKVFEIGASKVGARSLLANLSLRERDPADYNWQPGYELPTTLTPITTPPIAPQAVPGWAVTPTTVKDASGTSRRPAVLLGWEPDQPDVRGIAYEVRSVGQTELAAQGSTQDVRAGGIIVVDGIIPGASMEARGRLVASRRTLWTSWTPFTAPDVKLGVDDISIDVGALFEEQGLEAIEYVNALPASGREDQLVFLRADGKLYRRSGGAWVPVVENALEGALDETNFAAGIAIPRVVASLPATGYTGQIVTLSTDGSLYRWNGTAWTRSVPASTITGALTAGQIAAGAIGADQIAAGAIVASKIAVSDRTNMVPDDQIQDLASWAGHAPSHISHSAAYGDNFTGSNSRGVFIVAPGGATGTTIASAPFPASPDDQFYTEGRAHTPAAVTPSRYAVLQFLDRSGAVIAQAVGPPTGAAGWSTMSATGAAPADTVAGRFAFHIPASQYGSQQTVFGGAKVLRRLTGELVVDGTITGNKIVANTITGGLLATSGVITTAAQITNGVITRAKIADAAIDSAKIEELTVGTLHLANGALVRGVTASFTRAQDQSAVVTLPGVYNNQSRLVVLVSGELTTRAEVMGSHLKSNIRVTCNGKTTYIATVSPEVIGYNTAAGTVAYGAGSTFFAGSPAFSAAAGTNTVTIIPTGAATIDVTVLELRRATG